MSAWIVLLLGLGTGVAFAGHAALFAVAYAPVRRRLRRTVAAGQCNPGQLAPFSENNIGVDPEAAYLFAPIRVQPGEVVVVRGRVDPDSPYASMTLYDGYMQGFPGSRGPTHLNDRDLRVDAEGRFEIVVSHADVGWHQWLDLGGRVDAVIAWRQAEGAVQPPTLEVLPLSIAMAGRTHPTSHPPRLTGPRSWPVLRALVVAWMTVRTVFSRDYIYTLATGQDAADFVRFEALGARMDSDHTGRALHLGETPTPHFDTSRDYPSDSLGAHMKAHFEAATLDVELFPTRYPMSRRGTWVKERWRYLHDARHVLLGLGLTVPEELVLHGFQFGQHATWSGALIMLVGFPLTLPFRVAPWRQLAAIRTAFRMGRQARLVVAVPVEDWVDEPIDHVRQRLGIVPLGQRYGGNGIFPALEAR